MNKIILNVRSLDEVFPVSLLRLLPCFPLFALFHGHAHALLLRLHFLLFLALGSLAHVSGALLLLALHVGVASHSHISFLLLSHVLHFVCLVLPIRHE